MKNRKRTHAPYEISVPCQVPLALATARRLRTEYGPGRLAALPGALCGGEPGATGRAAGVDRDVDSFSRG